MAQELFPQYPEIAPGDLPTLAKGQPLIWLFESPLHDHVFTVYEVTLHSYTWEQGDFHVRVLIGTEGSWAVVPIKDLRFPKEVIMNPKEEVMNSINGPIPKSESRHGLHITPTLIDEARKVMENQVALLDEALAAAGAVENAMVALEKHHEHLLTMLSRLDTNASAEGTYLRCLQIIAGRAKLMLDVDTNN